MLPLLRPRQVQRQVLAALPHVEDGLPSIYYSRRDIHQWTRRVQAHSMRSASFLGRWSVTHNPLFRRRIRAEPNQGGTTGLHGPRRRLYRLGA